jgi:hypothetical protein
VVGKVIFVMMLGRIRLTGTVRAITAFTDFAPV